MTARIYTRQRVETTKRTQTAVEKERMTMTEATKRKPVFGIKGVAEYFGITPDAAQWHIRQGRIPVGHMGKRIVADPDKLDEVISDITSGRAA